MATGKHTSSSAPSSRSIDRSLWDKMLSAWHERPSQRHIIDECEGVGRTIAKQAIQVGWPDQGFPPFMDLSKGSESVLKKVAKTRQTWEDSALVQGEATRQAAEEAMAARTVMGAGMRTLSHIETYIGTMMEKLSEQEDAGLPEDIGPKEIKDALGMLSQSTGIIERAMKLERMRMGEPEEVLGITIGMMIERVPLDQLRTVALTGHMPAEFTGQRQTIMARIAATGETDAEARALAIETESEVVPHTQEDIDEFDPELFAAALNEELQAATAAGSKDQ